VTKEVVDPILAIVHRWRIDGSLSRVRSAVRWGARTVTNDALISATRGLSPETRGLFLFFVASLLGDSCRSRDREHRSRGGAIILAAGTERQPIPKFTPSAISNKVLRSTPTGSDQEEPPGRSPAARQCREIERALPRAKLSARAFGEPLVVTHVVRKSFCHRAPVPDKCWTSVFACARTPNESRWRIASALRVREVCRRFRCRDTGGEFSVKVARDQEVIVMCRGRLEIILAGASWPRS